MRDEDHCNEVHLVGRLSGPVTLRQLSNGRSRATWRLVVRRPAGSPDSRTAVDTVDCGTWEQVVTQDALTWNVGDQVEVWGALRRRFWRANGSLLSSYEVDVSAARPRRARSG